jgi:hypothetical protein
MAPSKELVTLSGNKDIATLDALSEILRGNAPLSDYDFEIVDNENAQQDILERILNADDDDEAENIGGALSWQNYLGIPMMIHAFRPMPSEKKGDGPPFYLLCELTNGVTGDNLTVSIGSWGVIAQLLNLAKRDKIPGAVRILTKGEETKAGRNPLKLISTQSEIDERAAAKAKDRL